MGLGLSSYQLRKARTIVAYLASLDVSHTRHQLAQCVALMTFDQWRTVAFSAGVPVADIEAKAAVLALPASHLWPLTTTTAATACPSTFPDLATSSPVPLPTSSSSPGPLTCGSTPIIHDGTYPIQLANTSVQAPSNSFFLVFPQSVVAALCNGSPCTNALTLGCTLATNAQSSNFAVSASGEHIFNIDSNGSHLALAVLANASGGQQLTALGFAVGSSYSVDIAATGTPYQIVYSFDGTTTSDFYVNGVLAGTNSQKPAQSGGGVGAFGAYEGGSNGFNGRMEDCFDLDTTALTAAQIQALYLVSGLP